MEHAFEVNILGPKFDGDCREAFELYRSVFGGEYRELRTFGVGWMINHQLPVKQDAVRQTAWRNRLQSRAWSGRRRK